MRGIISTFTGAATLLAVTSSLSAQQPRKAPPPPREGEPRGTVCYSTDKERSECTMLRRSSMDSTMMKRAALGLQLTSTGTARDTIGVFVSRVVPKGPAENAGIVEGDRIVSINGTDLRVSPADAGDSYAGELPSRRLSRAVEKLSPGNVVTLRVSSGGRVHDVQVTAGRAYDLRDSGFAYMPGGMDGMLRSLPRMNMEDFRGMQMEMPRMNMEYFPRMNMEMMPKMNSEQMKHMEEGMQRMKENMPMLRERMQELPMRLREMEMSPMYNRMRDGGTYKTFGPSRVRVRSPEGSVYIYRDSAGRKSWTTDSKSRAEKAATEKAAAEKVKNDKKKD